MVQRKFSLRLRGALLIALLCCIGCGSKQGVEVRGSVTNSDGSPLPRIRVVFRSSEDSSLQARAVTDMDGQFELTRGGELNLIPEGQYEVLLAPVQTLGEGSAGGYPIPVRYATFRSSGLKAEVSSDSTVHDFVVEKGGR